MTTKTLNDCLARPTDPMMTKWVTSVREQLNKIHSSLVAQDYNSLFTAIEQFTDKKSPVLLSHPGKNKLFVQQNSNFNIATYINYKGARLQSANIDKFNSSLYKMVTTEPLLMFLANEEMPNKEEIICSIIIGISTYFQWWTPSFDRTRCLNINISDITVWLKDLFSSDINKIKEQMTTVREIGEKFVRKVTTPKLKPADFCPSKPTCAEDLTSLFEEGMTTAEKCRAISKYWECSERQAHRYLDKFGIERKLNKDNRIFTDKTNYKIMYEEKTEELERLKKEFELYKQTFETFKKVTEENIRQLEMKRDVIQNPGKTEADEEPQMYNGPSLNTNLLKDLTSRFFGAPKTLTID